MIIREFRCLDCGQTFEDSSDDPLCPRCTGDEAERVFLTPPAVRSDKTGRADKIQAELAADFGMSNMSNRHGQAVKQAPTQGQTQFAAPTSVMPALQRLGSNADGFSPMLPSIRAMGGPTSWRKSPLKH